MSSVAPQLVSFDVDELAARMAEAAYGLRRPSGLSGTEAVQAMEEAPRHSWRRAALAALRYFSEATGMPLHVADQGQPN